MPLWRSRPGSSADPNRGCRKFFEKWHDVRLYGILSVPSLPECCPPVSRTPYHESRMMLRSLAAVVIRGSAIVKSRLAQVDHLRLCNQEIEMPYFGFFQSHLKSITPLSDYSPDQCQQAQSLYL